MMNYEKIYDEIREMVMSTCDTGYTKGAYDSVEEAIADVMGHSDAYITSENFTEYEDEDMTAEDWFDYYREWLEDTVRDWYEADKEEEED